MNSFFAFFEQLGVRCAQHVLLHAAWRKVRAEFDDLHIRNLLNTLQEMITPAGSLIMPVFTYCFRRSNQPYEIFDRKLSVSKVGAVSEVFRTLPGVIRTASPTHSFALWGSVIKEISADNNPPSPLGKGSVLDWMVQKDQSFILLLGVDFSSLSFGHYVESCSDLVWKNVSPWKHLQVLESGVSREGEFPLQEVPGCSKAFINWQNHLLDQGKIKPVTIGKLQAFYLPVKRLFEEGLEYARIMPENWLCPMGSCPACDERWEFYLNVLKHSEGD